MTQASFSVSSSLTYDVFISFRGIDTRDNFTRDLYDSLDQSGIHTFFDEEEIQKGEEITPALFQAIQESRIFIVVFSNNYASSTFCLNELVVILDCSNTHGRLLLPVFYDVDPSQVRHQSGVYGDALKKHEKRFSDDKVQKWRDALCKAAEVSGWHFKHGSQSEYKFIGNIVEEVTKKINRTPLHVADNPVALESPVLEVASLLKIGSDEGANMVGIYGSGGAGKSTLARAVYNNQISDQFDGVCFLAGIRESAINHGLAQLQETLLSEILGEVDIRIRDVYRGISIIKRRLRRKKVLLVLDDVDKVKQIQVLAGGHDWFGSGSKIIITTRDKHLLAIHEILNLYEVIQLNHEKSLELFNWHAFRNRKMDPCYSDISNRAVSYAHGLPLALVVIGSHLFGKRLDVCKSALDKYERILHEDIHEVLKVSYEDLDEDDKGIFLDIACFFNSYDMSYAKEMLYLHGFSAENGIQVLTDKSLIKIDGNGCVRMHDLVQDMGREIVRKESTSEPGKRSRLWSDDDIIHVLEENTGTDTVEVIIIDLYNDKEVQWSGEAFKKMKKLKILIIRSARFSRGPQQLPNSLRVLDWSGYSSQSLPGDFNPKKLTILSLHESDLISFISLKVFESLSFLDFEGCKLLTELPCISGLVNLGALCLDDCTNLTAIHKSVGFLNKLVLLSTQRCNQLEFLVPNIHLPSLETLDMRGCWRLKSFPEVLGVMKNIRDVYLDQTSIKKLPFSIRNLVGLRQLFLRECKSLTQLPDSIRILPKLEIIMDYGCIGFRLFEDKEKVGSKVFPKAMLVYKEGSPESLDMSSLNICPDNAIEVFSTSILGLNADLMDKGIFEGRGNRYQHESIESSLRFWFQNKFPKIALCCVVETPMCKYNMLLDFKLSVLINGTKQFTSSCNYIFSAEEITELVIACDLVCKVERSYEEHEWNQVDRTPLHVADNPVALESPVLEVASLLGIGSDEGANMVGIYGTGGVGKSTLARAVYNNQISDQFDGVCFLDDIRKNAINYGLVQLQETLLSEILCEKDIRVGSVNRGISIIKRRLQRKKVLLVLDDVDKAKQIQVLAGGHDWFGSGSKIIITTRDKHLLAIHEILNLYEVKELNHEKSLELFNWHAFKNRKMDPCYRDISNRAVSYAHGLPLALEVIGSHLFGKRLDVWKSALDKYEKILHADIHEVLKVSYDDLDEDDKGIFLDIACFFNSYKMSYAKEMLYVHGFSAENGIQVLTDKSLIKIDGNGCVRMHDLVQDMGREIVRQESTLEPGKRSRLWSDDDIIHVLEENTGTDAVEVIIIDLYNDKEVQWSGEAFMKMKNLKILIIRSARFSRGPQKLPNSLRVLDWSGYSSESLPDDFNPKKLMILSLHESCLKSFKSLKVFESLSFLDFEGCTLLTELPSLSGLVNLGALCLDDCTNLIAVHKSVGFLNKLVLLSTQRCIQLELLVPNIYLPSLETLDMRGCSRLNTFPEVLGIMENIRVVYIDQTSIDKLPFSIQKLVGLRRLFLRECASLTQLPDSIRTLPKLEITMAYGCRGFQLFEDTEKVGSKVFPKAMLVYKEGSPELLDMSSLNICPDNAIEVISTSILGLNADFMGKGIHEGRGNWYQHASNESSLRFWFQNKFPKIALCCAVETPMCNYNMLLDFKLSVLINGTKQFTSSCNYIFSAEQIILLCDLECKVERLYLEHEWNQVEISYEFKYLMPCGSKRVMATHDRTTTRNPNWSFIYAYEDYKVPVKFLSEFVEREEQHRRNITYFWLARSFSTEVTKKKEVNFKMFEKLEGPAIGIDLGTMYSCVGGWKHDRVEILRRLYQGNYQGAHCCSHCLWFSHDQHWREECLDL